MEREMININANLIKEPVSTSFFKDGKESQVVNFTLAKGYGKGKEYINCAVYGDKVDVAKTFELINMVMQKNNMHDTDTFEFFKYIIKMWIAVWLVSNAFTFSMAVFDVAQNLVNQAAGVINTSAVISGEEIVQMVEKEKCKSRS